MAKARYAACMACRSEAQKVAGITDAQHGGLSLGRPKGTNNRAGYKHREESKAKTAAANKAFWAANPDKLEERAAKTRAENNYNWKGGTTKLNKAIRTMRENRKWMDAVKSRDGKCVRCGSIDKLESHHLRQLSDLIEMLGINSLTDARRHKAALFDINNGETLCEACHYAEHGRKLAA